MHVHVSSPISHRGERPVSGSSIVQGAALRTLPTSLGPQAQPIMIARPQEIRALIVVHPQSSNPPWRDSKLLLSAPRASASRTRIPNVRAEIGWRSGSLTLAVQSDAVTATRPGGRPAA